MDYDWAAHYYDEGFATGKTTGYDAGSLAGYDAAYPAAFAAAYDAGRLDGLETGAREGTAEGGLAGFDDGWDAGYAEGQPAGFDAGFASYVYVPYTPPTFNYTSTLPTPFEVITPVIDYDDFAPLLIIPFELLAPPTVLSNFTLIFPPLIPPLELEVPEPSTLALAALALTAARRRRLLAPRDLRLAAR
jgi:hypothetical protein